MNGLTAALVAAVPSPSPLRPDIDPIDVSPGLAGFVATFAIALGCVALFLGLTRQLRRMRHNATTQGVGEHGLLPDAAGAAGGLGAAGRMAAQPEAGRPGKAATDASRPGASRPGAATPDP